MNNRFLVAFGVGIAVIAVAVCGILYMQRGARVGVTGQILKVRTAPLDDNSSVAVIDFRFVNPADVVFVVHTVSVLMEDKAGTQYTSSTISDMDATRLFEGLPLLGQKYNDTLVIRDKIPSRASMDRMVAARFEVPESTLEARKRLVVRIEEVDGKVFDLSER